MVGFLRGCGIFFSKKRAGFAFTAKIVSMLFLCAAAVSGCKRRQPQSVDGLEGVSGGGDGPAVVTNRMQDPVYRQALDDNRQSQVQKAAVRHAVVGRMERMIAEVRAALPAGADDEAVKAELAKRPEWKVLEEENARALAEVEATLAEARESIRRRMEAEARDVKAVAEGRAVPVAPTQRQ